MGHQNNFTSRTLQPMEGLGLERKSGMLWFDLTCDVDPLDPRLDCCDNLSFHPSVARDHPLQRPRPPLYEPVNEAVFTHIFQRSPDAMTLSSLEEGRFVAVNDRFLELSEYERHELINTTSTELKMWPKPQMRALQRQKLEQQGALYNEEGGFRTKSGQYKTVRVSAEIIPVGDAAYILCSIRDITQEKKAEVELGMANERDRLLGKLALNIRASLDLNQILQTTVQEVRTFLGVERVFVAHFDDQKNCRIAAESVLKPFPSLTGEVIGKELYDELSVIYQDKPIRVINDIEEIPESSCLYLLVQKYQVKAGLAVPILVNGSLFGVLVAHQCEHPRPWTEFEQELLLRLATQATIAIHQSELFSKVQYLNAHLEQQVTERTQELATRTKELEERTQELEELGEFRDFLLHAVTHDLQTSSVGMTMLLQHLDGQAGESSVRLPRGLLKNMIRAGNKQRDKLNAIQEVYRIELQGLPLQPTAIASHSLVNHVIEPLQARIDQSQAMIENALSPKLPQVQGDTIQLERVFQHLITNAIAHNPPGIKIEIQGSVEPRSCQPDDQPHDQPMTQPWLYIQVTDDGCGIEPKKRDRIFQLCSDCPEVRQYGGIRLGLYLCHQIINAHGGQIGIESKVGAGTTVWFKLPCVPTE